MIILRKFRTFIQFYQILNKFDNLNVNFAKISQISMDPPNRQDLSPSPKNWPKTFYGILQSKNPASVIYVGFFRAEVHQMFWGQIFEDRNEIVPLSNALKFRVIYKKYALNLLKI